jgi:undecaprenyl-diphosphatase
VSTALAAAVLGVVQGITEFLPVSSTAHLLIGERLLGFDDPGSVFTEMIQLGSILAIVWLYRAKILDVLTALPTRPEARRFVLAVVTAFVPAVIAGALLSGFIERVLHRSVPVIASSFILGGLVMLVVERRTGRPSTTRADDTTLAQATGIGISQVLALVPGVSRSGATIVGGMLAGLDRPSAAEFSFFLAMPTMSAAFLHSFLELRHQLTPDRGTEIAIGFVTAFIASLLVVKPFLGYVRRAGFTAFAWYRIAAGVALFAAFAGGLL